MYHIQIAELVSGLAEKVDRFRYEIYVEEMKRPQRYSDNASRSIHEPLDEVCHHPDREGWK